MGEKTSYSICHFFRDTYTEQGATVTDNSGEVIAPTIDSSAVDTSITGTYEVTYDAEDSSGDSAIQVSRTVILALPVEIDVKPGPGVPSINTAKDGNIPVVLYGSADLDVTQVDINGLEFGPAKASPINFSFKDKNRDGFMDLNVKFSTTASGIQTGDTEVCLTGTTNAITFVGCDTIRAR